MQKPIYNKKNFMLPDSSRSMSCFHAKVMEDGIMKLTIHDCIRSIQLKNDLNNPEEVKEAIEKLSNFANGILDLLHFIQNEYDIQQNKPVENFRIKELSYCH
jgi:hypothetical protein